MLFGEVGHLHLAWEAILHLLGLGGKSRRIFPREIQSAWPPPPRGNPRAPPPLPLPLYIVEGWEGCHNLAFGAFPPSSNSFSSSVVLGEALLENHELHHHHAVVLSELSLNFSSPLAGSRRRRRPRAVRVLNVEAPSVRR